MASNKPTIHIIGAGLAGSEACYYLLKKGFPVVLHERRPAVSDGAHETGLFGELVCSNSLKSKRTDNACGLLKQEMAVLGSIMMEAAAETEVPSGDALSVDRTLFAEKITAKLRCFPNLTIVEEEIEALPKDEITIVATGPLTGGKLMDSLCETVGEKSLSFFDASAPIVKKESIDFSIAYYKSRYAQGDAAYINCPFNKEQYFHFVTELVQAKKALLHEFDTHYFEGCLPVEIIASRGIETLRHGPLKPFGLEKEPGQRPYAVLQLRQDNALGDCYNLVGFQTNLTYPEQKRVFSLIPGLEHAEFVRYGLMHRNSYLNAPSTLNADLSLVSAPNIFIAGQLSGVEGYVESAAMGIVAAIEVERRVLGLPRIEVPLNTMFGSLLSYLRNASSDNFSPMNANWALYPGANKHNHEACASIALQEILRYKEAVYE